MSKPRIIQLKGLDGSIVSVEATKDYPIERWNQQKCWAFFCDNPFYFIHISKSGYATHAYCYHQLNKLPKLGKGQKWVHIEKGKFVIDKEFNGRKK